MCVEDKGCRGGQREKCQGDRQRVYLLFRRELMSAHLLVVQKQNLSKTKRKVAYVRG